MCGKPLHVNNDRVSLTKDGFPTQFLFFKDLIDSGKTENIKIVLTILSITRAIKPRKEEIIPVDYSTITDPYKGKRYIIPNHFIRQWVDKNGLLTLKPVHTFKDFYLSTKVGPNGPATLSIWKTITYLSYEQLHHIYNIITGPLSGTIDRFYTWCMGMKDLPASRKDSHQFLTTGRLAVVKDPECKNRVIAIVDYLSQVALRPIHDILLKKLRKMECDRTFTQDPRHKWDNSPNLFWSLDLSAATDRFPVRLQQRVLQNVFGDSKFAQHWASLLTQRNYTSQTGQNYKYSVGQPMGAYSSWAAFTLTHHMVVAWCAHLCGIPNFNQYIILGDDIVIHNDKVATKYKVVMSKLGVDISEAKTHVSKDTYEFAKRWIKGRKELTGLPLRGILNNVKNPFIVYNNLFDYVWKGNYVQWRGTLEGLVCNMYRGTKFLSKKFNLRRLKSDIKIHAFSLRFSLGIATDEEIRRTMLGYSPDWHSVPWDPRPEFIRVVSQGLEKAASDSLGRVYGIFDNYIKYFKDQLKLSDLNVLKDHPIFIGVWNHVSNTKERQEQFEYGKTTLQQAIKEIVYIDTNQLVSWDRNIDLLRIQVTNVIRQGLRLLSKDTGDWYMGGSSFGVTTYDSSNRYPQIFLYSSNELLMKLRPIMEGVYKDKKPQSLDDIFNDYESFFDVKTDPQ